MKAHIYVSPFFYIELTSKHVALLMKLSHAHYDYKCKETSAVGGFIFGWKNVLDFHDRNRTDGAPATVRADFGEIDLCLKILEIASFPGSTVDEEYPMVVEMRRSFHTILQTANQMTQGVYREVDA